MQTFSEKLNESKEHILHGDTNLGYRLLLDCVLDTQDLDIYKEVIAIEIDKEKDEKFDILPSCIALIENLSKIDVTTKNAGFELVHAKGIFKKYRSGHFSLGPVDVKVHQGEILGLVGENGNGKTTLLRILAKDLRYDRGEIAYNLSTKFETNYDLRTKLTYLPQRTPTWYGSLVSNLKYCASHYGLFGERNDLQVQMMIIRFGLWKYRNLKWNELSSGYKMRFELARTFLRAPELLFLDEPLANLDVLAQQLILEDLKNMTKSLSNPLGIILSSQQLFEVEKIADDVIFLKNGKPVNLKNQESFHSENVLEIETNHSKSEIQKALMNLDIKSISYNGGVYTIILNENVSVQNILERIVQNKLEIKYFRDISSSTKRLFV